MEVGQQARRTVDTALSFTDPARVPRLGAVRTGTFAEVYAHGQSKSFAGKSKTTILGGGGGDDDLSDGQLTVATASFNLTNSIVGAGMVGLAFVGSQSGIIPFVAFLAFAGLGSILTLDMLAAGADMVGLKDFERIGMAALGPGGKWASAIVISLNTYSFCIAYIVLISTTAPVVGVAFGFEVDPVVLQILIALVVVLPLCIMKSLESLASSAIAAIAIYLFTACFVIYSGFFDNWYEDGEVDFNGTAVKACPPATEILWFGPDLVTMTTNLPTIILAYVCHQASPPVFNELEGGEVKDMNKVHRASIGMAFALYGSVGVAGYFAFTTNTFSSVLMNLRHCVCVEWSGPEACTGTCLSSVCADDNPVASFVNVAFLFAVITGFPVVHFSLRKSLVSMIWGDGRPFSWPIHIGVAVFNVLLCLVVGIFVGDNISLIFNWSGSIASPALAFILPSIFFITLLQKSPRAYDTVGLTSARAFFVIGVVMIVAGVALQTLNTFG